MISFADAYIRIYPAAIYVAMDKIPKGMFLIGSGLLKKLPGRWADEIAGTLLNTRH